MSVLKSYLMILCGILIVMFLTGCSASTPIPSLSDDEFELAVFELCRGNRDSIEGAKPYNPADSYHPVMWIDAIYSTYSSSRNQTFYLYTPIPRYDNNDDWVEPDSIYGYDLVACMEFIGYERESYECNYGSVWFVHMETNYLFTVYTLESGENLGSFTITVKPHTNCADTTSTNQIGEQIVGASLSILAPEMEDLRNQLTPYVFTNPDSETP